MVFPKRVIKMGHFGVINYYILAFPLFSIVFVVWDILHFKTKINEVLERHTLFGQIDLFHLVD